MTKGRWQGDGPMSYREAHKHIVDTYMLQLKSAPFDITNAQLLPKAGACGPCAKRTGNQADLFGDVKSGDVCTDPKCFDDKPGVQVSGGKKHGDTITLQISRRGPKFVPLFSSKPQ